jgi:hypothetical protein
LQRCFLFGFGKSPLAKTSEFFTLFAFDPFLPVEINPKERNNRRGQGRNNKKGGLYVGDPLTCGR